MTAGITDAQRIALATLAPSLDAETYLAGGVAIAIALHHRTSLDLDLFVPHDFDPDRLLERISADVPAVRAVGRARGTLHLEVSGIPVSILSYRYPLLEPVQTNVAAPIPIAALEDLACMKLSAIAGRGAAKDFWDLHALLEAGVACGSLGTALELFRRKFPVDDVGHVVRALAYFGDADAAPLPAGLTAAHWHALKDAWSARVKAL